jgi:hypothetical protein
VRVDHLLGTVDDDDQAVLPHSGTRLPRIFALRSSKLQQLFRRVVCAAREQILGLGAGKDVDADAGAVVRRKGSRRVDHLLGTVDDDDQAVLPHSGTRLPRIFVYEGVG